MARAARGLAWEILELEQIMVSYYGGAGPHDRWEECAKLVGELRSKPQMRFLVYQMEQPPLTAMQSLLGAVRGGRWRVAMVSPSISMRFVASSFELVVKNARFFAPEALHAALEHLGCTEAEKRKVSAILERLRTG